MNEYDAYSPQTPAELVAYWIAPPEPPAGARAWRTRRRTAAELAVAIQLAPGEDMRTTVF